MPPWRLSGETVTNGHEVLYMCTCIARTVPRDFTPNRWPYGKAKKKSYKIIIIQYISGNKNKKLLLYYHIACASCIFVIVSVSLSYVADNTMPETITSDLLHNRIIKHYIKFLIFFTLVRGWFRFIILHFFSLTYSIIYIHRIISYYTHNPVVRGCTKTLSCKHAQ
jgi:hypothetical protein